jgi:uncharacterized membrane protein YgaE (UPF0421/DUF939 family)
MERTMKFIKKSVPMLIAIIFSLTFVYLFNEYKYIQYIAPYILIIAIYIYYDAKLENISMDLLVAEEQIEELSNGEWTIDTRFRGNPYEA